MLTQLGLDDGHVPEIELEFDGKKHGTVDIRWDLEEQPNLYEYILVPNPYYDSAEDILTIPNYSLIHINDIESYRRELVAFSFLVYSGLDAVMPHAHYMTGDNGSMPFELPKTTDLDEWLTSLPDDYLKRLLTACDQVNKSNVRDQEALTHVVALILHFCGKPALNIPEITDLFPEFAICMAMESLLREGKVTKQGKYSIVKGEQGASFAMVKPEETGKPGDG